MFVTAIIEALNAARLPYALVGGYAVALHGAVRGTVDLDIVIRLKRKEFERLETVLLSQGLRPRLPVSAGDVFMFREEYIKNRNLIAWSFVNPDRPSELVDVIITEDLANLQVVKKKALGLTIKLASIPDLIRMKKVAARPQDLLDIEALEALL